MSVRADNNTLSLGSGIKMYGNEGYIWAKEVTVMADNPYPDYVFGDSYQLMELPHLKQYIQQHQHLPNIPSAGEIAEKGIDMGKMNILMMEKIEELTLYILQQNEKIQQLQQQIDDLKK